MRKGWDGEWKKWNGKKNGENSSPLTFLPVNGKRLQYRHLCQIRKQAGAELGQAQVKQEVVDEVLAEAQLKLQLQLQWKLEFTTFSVGWVGVFDEIKAILNSS